MRNLQLLLILIFALTIGYFIWQTIDGTSSQPTALKKELQLVDLPIQYCPKEAKIVATLGSAAVRTGRVVPVINCRTISLENFTAAKLYIKLPQALSFAITLPTAGSISYAPELGDVNEDGSINAIDETIVSDNLFATGVGNEADVDSDGSVTTTDLVLVRLHQGVSATAGDNGDQIIWDDIN